MPSALTVSSWLSASISRWATPGVVRATSAQTTLVARQGAQNADENCKRVILPGSWRRLMLPVTELTFPSVAFR